MALKWVSFTAAFTEKMRSKDYLMDSFEVIHVFFFLRACQETVFWRTTHAAAAIFCCRLCSSQAF